MDRGKGKSEVRLGRAWIKMRILYIPLLFAGCCKGRTQEVYALIRRLLETRRDTQIKYQGFNWHIHMQYDWAQKKDLVSKLHLVIIISANGKIFPTRSNDIPPPWYLPQIYTSKCWTLESVPTLVNVESLCKCKALTFNSCTHVKVFWNNLNWLNARSFETL